MHPEQVIGAWEKDDDTLPPVHLRLWLERDTLRARLRLSGSESAGTATIQGSEIQLRLSGRDVTIVGEFISKTELRLGLGGRSYLLRPAALPFIDQAGVRSATATSNRGPGRALR